LFYATQLDVIKPAAIQSSLTYSFIEPFGPKMIDILGSVLPFFKDMFGELLQFFETVGEKNAMV
jgi:membrane protein required for colicin V production